MNRNTKQRVGSYRLTNDMKYKTTYWQLTFNKWHEIQNNVLEVNV